MAVCKPRNLCIEVHPCMQDASIRREEQEQSHGDEAKQGHEKVPEVRWEEAIRVNTVN